MSPFDPLFEAFLYVCGGGCCFFSAVLFSLYLTRAVSERMDFSTLMTEGMFFPATDSSFAGFYIRACRLGLEHSHKKKWLDPLLAFQENASIPGRVYAYSRSPGSSTRLCAVIHLCGGQGVARVAWLGSAWAGQFRWADSLGSEVAGPWSFRGSREGILLHQVGAEAPHSSRGLSAQIFRRRHSGE